LAMIAKYEIRRKVLHRSICLAAIMCLLLIYTGCFPGSTFQTPIVLPEGEYVQGIGFTISSEYFLLPGAETYIRMGLINSPSSKHAVDMGLKFAGLPNSIAGFCLDFKYQLLSGPVSMAGVLGTSVLAGADEEDISGELSETGYLRLQSTLLIGNEHVYGGIKAIIPPSLNQTPGNVVPAAFIGFSTGNEDWQILPEITVGTRT